jgi:hypothetical protein
MLHEVQGEEDRGGSHEHLIQSHWQERDWEQLLGRFGDILLIKDVSATEGYKREKNTYVTLDAHSTS